MTDILPQEIIDTFITGFPTYLTEQEAKRSLIACTQVSRSFSRPARRQLFAKVRLAASPPYHAHQEANEFPGEKIALNMWKLRMLLRSPKSDFASLIRTVHIDVGKRRKILREAHEMHRVLDTIVALGPNRNLVDTVWITGHPERSFRWNDVDTITSQSILSLLDRSPNIMNLRFSNIMNLPLTMTTSLPNLRSLELYEAILALSNGPRDVSHSCSRHLDYLCIHQDINTPIADSPWILAQSITRVNISVLDLPDAVAAWKIIDHTSRHLQCLDLVLHMDERFLSISPIDIGHLPSLHTLNLHIHTNGCTTIPPLDDIFALLDPPTQPTSIKSLNVFFNSVATSFLPILLLNPADDSWQALHPSVLLEKHPGLRSIVVEMDLHVKPLGTWPLSQMEEVLKDEMRAAIVASALPLPPPQSCTFSVYVTARC